MPQDVLISSLNSVEKYGVLGLFGLVIVGIGFFLWTVGRDLVKAVNSNTSAVTKLVGKIDSLIEDHEREEDRRQAVYEGLLNELKKMHGKNANSKG